MFLDRKWGFWTKNVTFGRKNEIFGRNLRSLLPQPRRLAHTPPKTPNRELDQKPARPKSLGQKLRHQNGEADNSDTDNFALRTLALTKNVAGHRDLLGFDRDPNSAAEISQILTKNIQNLAKRRDFQIFNANSIKDFITRLLPIQRSDTNCKSPNRYVSIGFTMMVWNPNQVNDTRYNTE